jgi:sugar O-acyltransferase (sialic acid O-acetyltransferase NeuD family)
MAGERILVWGAGGHGKVVGDLVRACGHHLVGFCGRTKPEHNGQADGRAVIATDSDLIERVQAAAELPGGARFVVPAVGSNNARLDMIRALADRCVPALVHPSATVSASATIGVGSVVFAGAVVNADASIGNGVIVNTNAVVEHDCVLGHGAHVSPGGVLAGGVIVGELAWVGAGAVVIQQVRIGPAAIVGAGAVVIRDVPEASTVVGNPAHRLR